MGLEPKTYAERKMKSKCQSFRQILGSVLVVGLSSRACNAQCWTGNQPCGPETPQGTWALREDLSDEFDGSSIDASKWNTHFPGWNGRAPGANSAQNVASSNGVLGLYGRYDPTFDFPQNDAGCSCDYQDFTTSVLMSKFTVNQGRLEVRAKAAPASFLSSFWLQSNSSEIGIFESVGASSINQSSMHYVDTSVHCFSISSTESSVIRTHTLGNNIVATDYHVYGLEWLDNSIRYYIDDTVVRTSTLDDCNNSPHHVVLSLETVESAGYPNRQGLAETGPVAFEVDYVRIWELESTQPTSTPTVAPTCTLSIADQFEELVENGTRMKRKSPNRARYDIGSPVNAINLQQCGELCIQEGDDCKAVEYHTKKGLCLLKNTAPTARLKKPVNKWQLWSRRAFCALPPWEDPTGCTSPPLERFQQFENTKYRTPLENDLPAESVGVCANACVRAGLGCLSFQYNKVFGRCYLYSFRKASGPQTKANNKFDVYDRTITCCGDSCGAQSNSADVDLMASVTQTNHTYTVTQVVIVGSIMSVLGLIARKRSSTKPTYDAINTREAIDMSESTPLKLVA